MNTQKHKLLEVKYLVKRHFLVKINQNKLFVMDCQEIERKSNEKEINKTHELCQ